MSDTEETEDTTLAKLSRAFAKVMGHADPDPAANSKESQTESEADENPSAVDDACPISPKTITEAILFVGHPENKAITAESIARLLRGVDSDEVDTHVAKLNEEYEATNSPFSIESFEDGYRMELREEFAPVRDRFYGRVREAKLSQHAIDVLAVVAYHQPITRERVHKLVNNEQLNTSRVLNQLVRRDLLEKRLTDDKPRRREYVTTERFLTLFNLSDLGDLPHSEEPA